MFGVARDGWLIGDEHPRVGFEGDDYEFVYIEYHSLNSKLIDINNYNKNISENYQVYNYI